MTGMIGWDITGQDTDNIELIDLNKNCTTSLPNYPMLLHGATGAFINEMVIVCGGCLYNDQYTNVCYKLSKGGVEFEYFTSMQDLRGFASGTVTQGVIWVTGGYHDGRLQSTEFISPHKVRIISIANFGPKFYLIKSSLILLELSHIFTR